jgi:hypothetical protein
MLGDADLVNRVSGAGHCVFGTASAEVWLTETAPTSAEVLSGDYELDKAVRMSTYGQLLSTDLVSTLYKHTLFDIVGYGLQDVQQAEVAKYRIDQPHILSWIRSFL